MNFNYIDNRWHWGKNIPIKSREPLLLKCTFDNEIFVALGLDTADSHLTKFIPLEDFRWEDQNLGLPFYNINTKKRDLCLFESYIHYWMYLKDISESSWIKYKKLKEIPLGSMLLSRIHEENEWHYAIFERRHHFISDPASRAKYSDEERNTYTVAFYSATKHIIAKASKMHSYILIDEYFINK